MRVKSTHPSDHRQVASLSPNAVDDAGAQAEPLLSRIDLGNQPQFGRQP
jgi:hypothetical protein